MRIHTQFPCGKLLVPTIRPGIVATGMCPGAIKKSLCADCPSPGARPMRQLFSGGPGHGLQLEYLVTVEIEPIVKRKFADILPVSLRPIAVKFDTAADVAPDPLGVFGFEPQPDRLDRKSVV